MNLQEGTRRLALLVGVVGAVCCGVLSYAQLQSNLRVQANYRKFEKLASSAVVGRARKECFGTKTTPANGPWEKYQNSAGTWRGGAWHSGTGQVSILTPPFCYTPSDDSNVFDYTPSQSSSGGIKTVHFESREIASIETQDGQTIYPTTAPNAWSYVLVVVIPMLGFFAPWGAIRAIGWVAAGFMRSSK